MSGSNEDRLEVLTDLAVVCAEPVAVVAIDTTCGHVPRLIVECAVLQGTPDSETPAAGPSSYWVSRDVPPRCVRPQVWPNLRLASEWPYVAEQLRHVIGHRILVMHDRRDYDLLRSALPGWEPPHGVLLTRDLVRSIWPFLPDYGIASDQSTVVQAYAVYGLLHELAQDARKPLDKRKGGTSPT